MRRVRRLAVALAVIEAGCLTFGTATAAEPDYGVLPLDPRSGRGQDGFVAAEGRWGTAVCVRWCRGLCLQLRAGDVSQGVSQEGLPHADGFDDRPPRARRGIARTRPAARTYFRCDPVQPRPVLAPSSQPPRPTLPFARAENTVCTAYPLNSWDPSGLTAFEVTWRYNQGKRSRDGVLLTGSVFLYE